MTVLVVFAALASLHVQRAHGVRACVGKCAAAPWQPLTGCWTSRLTPSRAGLQDTGGAGGGYTVRLRFGGIYKVATVWLNGKYMAQYVWPGVLLVLTRARSGHGQRPATTRAARGHPTVGTRSARGLPAFTLPQPHAALAGTHPYAPRRLTHHASLAL